MPEPDGPSSARSSPRSHRQADALQRDEAIEVLGDVDRFDAHACFFFAFEQALRGERHEGEERQQRSDGEGGGEIIFVIEDFDMQRHGVGQAAYMAGDDRDRAELAHGARIAQEHAVEQAPFDVGQRHAEEGLQAGGAERHRCLLVLGALLFHQRDEFARDEGKGHEHGGEHDARQREDDLDVMLAGARGRASPAARTAARR